MLKPAPSAARPAVFESSKQIRFHHCDPAGIVFYPQYFVLFNETVEDWFNQGLGIDFALLHSEHRLGVPLARVECEFLAPSGIGDRLLFRLSVARIGRSSITLVITGVVGEEPRIRATLVLVLASLETRRAVALPADFREKIQRFVL
jgi:4-hydroxybenzoyl-CoA thioesterase